MTPRATRGRTPGYELTLFVSGASDLSARAIADARTICDTYVHGRYELAVVDVHTADVDGSRMIATPTLMRSRPRPQRKVVGDLSHHERVRAALDLPPRGDLWVDRSRRSG